MKLIYYLNKSTVSNWMGYVNSFPFNVSHLVGYNANDSFYSLFVLFLYESKIEKIYLLHR